MKYISLTKGRLAIVDDEDFERVNKYKWYFERYATHKSKNECFRMHNLIMNAKEVDHINGNKLDNRRENLRVVTRSQNNWNQKKTRGASIYKGVSWHKQTKKWRVRVNKFGKEYGLGLFENEKEAAVAYDEKAKELFGNHARLNF